MILRMTALLLIWAASTLHAQPIPAPLDLGASNGTVALRNVHVLSPFDALATGTRYVGDYLAEMGHTGTELLEITQAPSPPARDSKPQPEG